MSCQEYVKRLIAYFSLLSLVCTSQVPSKLFADPGCCALVDREEARRTRIATVVAGASVLVLIGGVAWLAFGSSGHRHHRRHHSYSYFNYSDHSHRHHHHNRDHDHHHDHDHGHRHHDHNHRDHNHHNHHHDHSLSFTEGLSRQMIDPQFFERGDFGIRGRKLTGPKESHQLSGVFTTHPSLSASSQGSITAFVRLPDGTTQVLGTLPFSSGGGSSLSYGPFTQKGTYTFGMSINEGSALSSQLKVGSVEVEVNGLTVESHDFFLPAHSPGHYEPHPCEYTLS